MYLVTLFVFVVISALLRLKDTVHANLSPSLVLAIM